MGRRKQPPETLRQNEERLRLLISSVKDYAILMLDQEGRVTTWNEGAERIKGYSAEEIIGQHFSRFYTPEAMAKNQPAKALEIAREQGSFQEEGWRVRKDGTRFFASVVITAIRDEKGQLRGFGKVTRDISERKRAEERLRQSEERLHLFISSVKDYAILMLDTEGRVTTWNEGAQRIKGYSAQEIIGQHFSKFYTAEAIAENHPAKELEIATELGRYEEEGWRLRKDGSRFFANVVITAIRDQQGRLRGFGKVTRDMTERKEAQDALFVEKERAQVTLNSIGDAVISTDISGNVAFLNHIAEKITGWLQAEAVGRSITEVFRVLDASSRVAIPDLLGMAIGENRPTSLPLNSLLIRRDGVEIPIEDSISPIRDREGRVTGGVIVFRDVTTARELSRQMVHLAQHDFLTGLPNRMCVEDKISSAIVSANRNNGNLAVLFLDLDGFKHINDSLGHLIGDKLLQSVASRLLSCVRGADTVSRQGGDEFIVLLSEVAKAEDPAICARRIASSLEKPHLIDDHELHISASIGVSVFPSDGRDTQTLVKNADTAMYQAKANGRQGYQFFERTMNERAVERQSIEEDLRRALEQREFVLHYQPKIDLTSGRITGAETLLRWTHPIRGTVPPAQFIPIAEDSGLIIPIGKWVLRQACAQAADWIREGLPLGTMAVNISAVEFRNEHFIKDLLATLKDTSLDPSLLELELTESVLMKHIGSTESILKALKTFGVKLAVDDFGTGYSSLSYLRKFPINALKIDRSFVQQISMKETSIVSAIISMGRSLGLTVVAEGVETEEELKFLRAHMCEQAQGYYFSRPVPAQAFATLLSTGLSNAASPH